MAIQHSLCNALRITTFTKNEDSPLLTPIPMSQLVLSKDKPLFLLSADEIPFVFYEKKQHLFGAMVISKQDSFDEKLYHALEDFIRDKKLNVDEICCYLGPSLTFSHVGIDRNTLISLIQKGYRAAAKRTNGVDYVDLPVMNMVMLRKIGISFSNIYINRYDTFEAEALLYSERRGDKKKNPTLIEMIRNEN